MKIFKILDFTCFIHLQSLHHILLRKQYNSFHILEKNSFSNKKLQKYIFLEGFPDNGFDFFFQKGEITLLKKIHVARFVCTFYFFFHFIASQFQRESFSKHDDIENSHL